VEKEHKTKPRNDFEYTESSIHGERYYDEFGLMFCAHHGKEYAEKLAAIAVKIQDETNRLVETK
jgi:hypothetical protein